MPDEKNTTFNYLLNAFEHASQEKYPAKAGYAGKRKALIEHVRDLERDAARYRWWREYAMQTNDVSADDAFLDCETPADVDRVIDAALGVSVLDANTKHHQPPMQADGEG